MLAELRNHARVRKEAMNRPPRVYAPDSSPEPPEELTVDLYAGFEKEWLDAEIAEGVTNRDVCRSLMMLMGRMG